MQKDAKYSIERRSVKVSIVGSICASAFVVCGLFYFASRVGVIAEYSSYTETATVLLSLQKMLRTSAVILIAGAFLQFEGLRNFRKLINRFEG